ncbi:MAG: hypothetical protein LBS81_00720 [Endomicrobium sp.]|nr:hypothetical protein [Endomicrobium sp.]
MQNIEKGKFYFFMLAVSNPQPIAIVKSPSDDKAIKNFLEYGFGAAQKATKGYNISEFLPQSPKTKNK